jgi:hypothetical protein
LSRSDLFGCLYRGDVVRVEYGDGGSEIAGILSREGDGYWVTVPAENVRRWVPDYAISECVSSSTVEHETSGENITKPARDRCPIEGRGSGFDSQLTHHFILPNTPAQPPKVG